MSKLTPFGIAVRKLRLEKGLRLVDMAEKLEMSTSFLSAIETGRKPIPGGFVVRISRCLDWSTEEIAQLRRAVDQTRKEVRIEGRNEEERELIAAFARRLDEVPPDTLENLKKLLLKSVCGEIPFERKRRGFVVPAASEATIRKYAEDVRSAFVSDDRIDFPIVEAIEFGLVNVDPKFVFDVLDEDEMGDDEGLVPVGGHSLILRRDVYDGACNGERRHRFTAAHEMGHYLMHRTIGLARRRGSGDEIFRDSEWQADSFAGALLMSSRHFEKFSSAYEMASKCITSTTAAEVMWRKYSKER